MSANKVSNLIDIAKDFVKYFNTGKTELLELTQERVIYFMIDGLRVDQAKKISKDLEVIQSLGIPSTAPVVTSVNLLKYPGEHGIYAWEVYLDKIGETFFPLIHKTREGNVDTKNHIMLSEFDTLYTKLKDVKSYILTLREYADSLFSKAIYKGAEIIGYRSLAEALVHIRDILNKHKNERVFIHLYYDGLDYTNHVYGPDSKHSNEELRLLNHIIKRLTKIAKNTNIIVTPDHGFARLNKKKAIDMDPIKDKIEIIAGEQRNVFIKPKDGEEETIINFLEEASKKKDAKLSIEVLDKKKIKKLLGEYSEKVKHLEGFIFVQVKDNSFIKRYKLDFSGDHGGASKEEMEIPLIIF